MASPTAGFGIGLQSIFLVAPKFEIYSKAAGEDCIRATVTSRRKNGYVQVSKSDKLKYQGTEIHVVVPKELETIIAFDGKMSQYLENDYDPLLNNKKDLFIIKFGMNYVLQWEKHIFQQKYILMCNCGYDKSTVVKKIRYM